MISRKAKAAIYRRAAEFTATGETGFYGYALDLAGQPNPGGDGSPLQDEFDALFKGVYLDWHAFGSGGAHTECAVLALLLMAEIVEQGE